MSTRFSGFTAEALTFLADLRDNNDRDWFASRKAFYEAELKTPMEALVYEVAAACQKKGLPLFAKDRSPVSRIYRDTRFSQDKSPFHHHVGATLHARNSAASFGDMCIHVAPEQKFVAAGFYMPAPAFLLVARTRIAEHPEEFEAVLKALGKAGLALAEESKLKRMPRGFERFAASAVAGYLKLNSLVVTRQLTPGEVETPALVRTVVAFALAARPLLEFGWGLDYRPSAAVVKQYESL